MPALAVPYIAQDNEYSCGVAAYSMVHRFLRPNPILGPPPAAKIWADHGEADPHTTGQQLITSDTIVAVARSQGFKAGWGRVGTKPSVIGAQILDAVNAGIPLIACQRPTPDDTASGHFRVIIGIRSDGVLLHDPDPIVGGPTRIATIVEMMKLWCGNGANVTGGVAIWISERRVRLRLGPNLPNPWHDAKLAIRGSV